MRNTQLKQIKIDIEEWLKELKKKEYKCEKKDRNRQNEIVVTNGT
jgi:hypothetical protein